MLNESSEADAPAFSAKQPSWAYILRNLTYAGIAFILPQFIVGVLFWAYAQSKGIANIDNWLRGSYVNAVYILIAELMTIGVLWRFMKSVSMTKADIKLKKPTLKAIVIGIIGFVIYLALTTAAFVVAGKLIPGFNPDQSQELGFDTSGRGLAAVAMFVGLVILVPVAEELLFRGFLYRSLRSKFHIAVSAIFVSVLFGVAHGQWNVGLDTAMVSLVMIWAIERSDNLWSSITMHMIKNGLAFYYLFFLSR